MTASSTTRRIDDLVYVGTHGHVIALGRRNGRKRWEISLPRTGYSVVSILVEDDQLTVASGGRVFGLDPLTGEIRWSNALRGKGTGHVYLATRRSSANAMPLFGAETAAQSQAHGGTSAATM